MASTLEVKDRALVDEAVSTGAAAALRECAQPSKGVVSKEEEVGQALRGRGRGCTRCTPPGSAYPPMMVAPPVDTVSPPCCTVMSFAERRPPSRVDAPLTTMLVADMPWYTSAFREYI